MRYYILAVIAFVSSYLILLRLITSSIALLQVVSPGIIHLSYPLDILFSIVQFRVERGDKV